MPVLGILSDKKDGSDLRIDVSSLEIIYNNIKSGVSNQTGSELLDLDVISNLRGVSLDIADARISSRISSANSLRSDS